MSMKCKCNICGKEFNYGDCQSPMLNGETWNKVVEFYSLKKFESKARAKYAKHIQKEGRSTEALEDEHLFICYTCMEKALGRKICKSDLIGEKGKIFNKAFEDLYFK